MSYQWTQEQIKSFQNTCGKAPENCTCGRETEPMPALHVPGCEYRMQYVKEQAANSAVGGEG